MPDAAAVPVPMDQVPPLLDHTQGQDRTDLPGEVGAIHGLVRERLSAAEAFPPTSQHRHPRWAEDEERQHR